MNKYESIFILRPDLEETRRVELIEKFKGIVGAQGEIDSVDEWGMRKLAYEIQKLREGYYVMFNFRANPALPMELERNFKITDEVIRYIVINRDEK